MDRILILIAAESWPDAAMALTAARDAAAAPKRLSYGVCIPDEPTEDDLAQMCTFGELRYLAPSSDAWRDMPALWRGETHVLAADPAMTFSRRWDAKLLRILRRSPRIGSGSALTGWLPTPAEPVDAVCAVAADGWDADGRLTFRRGTPLRWAKQPMLSAFLHPGFCFAPAAFFRMAAEETDTPFTAARRKGWGLYTLPSPVVRLRWESPIPPAAVRRDPESDWNGRFGVDPETKKLTAQARVGIFTADLRYPLHVPPAVRAQEAMRRFRTRGTKITPLCATVWHALPEPGRNLPDECFLRFSRLAGVKNLSLLCYADGDMARRVMQIHPNVLSFSMRYGLPVQGTLTPARMLDWIKLSKPFILSVTREKFLSHTHYVWIDFDYLRYPVYSRAAIDWRGVCTDKIVLATVDGQPDLSMITVPETRLNDLCAGVRSQCRTAAALTGELPDETAVWTSLLMLHPDWFDTIELPVRGALLELTMMARGEEASTEA